MIFTKTTTSDLISFKTMFLRTLQFLLYDGKEKSLNCYHRKFWPGPMTGASP